MLERLDTYKQIVTQQWETLSPRDRLALKCLTGVLMVVALFGLVWSPAVSFKADAKAHYQRQAELLSWVESQQKSLGGSRAFSRSDSSQSLVSLITNTSSRNQLTIERYTPRDNNRIKVWLQDTDFNRLMRWLHTLKQTHNVSVADISIDRESTPGLVRVNLELER